MFHNIESKNIRFVLHSAIAYRPKILRNEIRDRRYNSFLFVQNGRYRYTTSDGSFTATDGDIIFLPVGASYLYEVLSGTATQSRQFEFSAIDNRSAEMVQLLHLPQLISSTSLPLMSSLICEIVSLYNEKKPGCDFAVTAGLNQLFFLWISGTETITNTNPVNKIAPAVAYLNKHYREKISVDKLATMCALSAVQFWRVFRVTYGVSPIEYKNRLLFNTAGELLMSSDRSISEIAESLKFSSVYAFSQQFKRRFGISPRAYRQNRLSADSS